MEEVIKFYYKPGACSLAVHIALIWASAKYEAYQVEIGSDDYKKINPLGSVPAIVYKNKLMTEAPSLLKFIANKYPEKNLVGSKDYVSQQEVDQWLSFLVAEVHKVYALIFATVKFTTKTDQDSYNGIKEAAINRLKILYAILEKSLSNKEYLANNVKTIVDCYLYVINRWMEIVTPLKLADFPNILKHFNLLSKDSGVIQAIKEEGLN